MYHRFLEFTGKANWGHISNNEETNKFYVFELKKKNLTYLGSDVKSYSHLYQQMQTTTYGEIDKIVAERKEARTNFLESLKGKDVILSGSYKTYLVKNLSEIYIDKDYDLSFKGDDIIRIPFEISTSHFDRIKDIYVAMEIINNNPVKYIELHSNSYWNKELLCHGIELSDELNKAYTDSKNRFYDILNVANKIYNLRGFDRHSQEGARSSIARLLENTYKRPSYIRAGLLIYAWWNGQKQTTKYPNTIPSDEFFVSHWDKACKKLGVSSDIYEHQFAYKWKKVI